MISAIVLAATVITLLRSPSAGTSPQGSGTSMGVAPAAGAQARQGPEDRLISLVNTFRDAQGCPRLHLDDQLTAMARAQATDMVRRAFVAHVNPDNQDETARARSVGYIGRVEENLALGMSNPDDVVAQWTNTQNPAATSTRRRLATCEMISAGVGYHPGTVWPSMGPGSWALVLGNR